jgi:hypothetical protein
LVEHDLAKVRVAGSSPVFRSKKKSERNKDKVLTAKSRFVALFFYNKVTLVKPQRPGGGMVDALDLKSSEQ